MKKIKCGMMLAMAILFFTQTAIAQQATDLKNKTPEQRAAFQTSMMKSKLNLDSGQAAKVQAINLKYAQKYEPIIKSDDSRFSRFRQAKALQKAKDAELKTVFTASQYKQYQDFEAEMKDKLKDKMASN
jgi:predicted nucleic acid binding AN1-type Zn finger protein